MAQILVFGASTAYGVGGPSGGWPDLLKTDLHTQMYAQKELPLEKHEVYNLCMPGATIADIKQRLALEIKAYSKPGRDTLVIIELGGNDSKATETADNFVNTLEYFYEQMKELAQTTLTLTKNLIMIGLQPVDEAKTVPRTNPNTGRKSFFTNERMKLFEETIAKVSKDLGVVFLPIFEPAVKENWQQKFLFDDGLHPNKEGHKWIYARLKPILAEILEA